MSKKPYIHSFVINVFSYHYIHLHLISKDMLVCKHYKEDFPTDAEAESYVLTDIRFTPINNRVLKHSRALTDFSRSIA